ncbi:MAG: fluoride efflux transporter CrcB [Gammaproteobacteria bacterium]|nr:fluoride efflux transporter CrcB [Gammaproteobacteria bacterium]
MVALGGALGACLRYGCSVLLAGSDSRFPWATLLVNVAGCAMAGFLTGWLLARGSELPQGGWSLLVFTGILGGFTTFSAFSVETLRLAESGDSAIALLNILANVLGALLAVFFGAWLARILVS